MVPAASVGKHRVERAGVVSADAMEDGPDAGDRPRALRFPMHNDALDAPLLSRRTRGLRVRRESNRDSKQRASYESDWGHATSRLTAEDAEDAEENQNSVS